MLSCKVLLYKFMTLFIKDFKFDTRYKFNVCKTIPWRLGINMKALHTFFIWVFFHEHS